MNAADTVSLNLLRATSSPPSPYRMKSFGSNPASLTFSSISLILSTLLISATTILSFAGSSIHSIFSLFKAYNTWSTRSQLSSLIEIILPDLLYFFLRATILSIHL